MLLEQLLIVGPANGIEVTISIFESIMKMKKN